MKRNLLLLFLLVHSILGFSQNTSPVILSTAGETFQNNNIQLDWTIGELAISTIQNENSQITQGFHQPFYTITHIKELPKAIGIIKLFPNPTSDYLSMELSFENYSHFHIQLFDTQGKLIWIKNRSGKEITESLSLGNVPNGSYYLHFVIDGQLYSQTFSIQKLK